MKDFQELVDKLAPSAKDEADKAFLDTCAEILLSPSYSPEAKEKAREALRERGIDPSHIKPKP